MDAAGPKANQPHPTCKLNELLHEPGSIQGRTPWNIIQMAYKREDLGWKFSPKQVWPQLHVILVNVKTFWQLLHTAIQTHGWCFPVIWSICALLEAVSSWASICLSGRGLLDLHPLWQLSTKLFLFMYFPPPLTKKAHLVHWRCTIMKTYENIHEVHDRDFHDAELSWKVLN